MGFSKRVAERKVKQIISLKEKICSNEALLELVDVRSLYCSWALLPFGSS